MEGTEPPLGQRHARVSVPRAPKGALLGLRHVGGQLPTADTPALHLSINDWNDRALGQGSALQVRFVTVRYPPSGNLLKDLLGARLEGGRGGMIQPPPPPPPRSPGFETKGARLGQRTEINTKRRGLALLGVRAQSLPIFEPGTRDSELGEGSGAAQEMPPSASRGSRFANQSCRNSGRPASASGLLGNTQQVWAPGAGVTAPRRGAGAAPGRSGAQPGPRAVSARQAPDRTRDAAFGRRGSEPPQPNPFLDRRLRVSPGPRGFQGAPPRPNSERFHHQHFTCLQASGR